MEGGKVSPQLRTTYVVLTIAFAVIVIIVAVYLAATDTMSLITFLLLIAVLVYILIYFGFVEVGASGDELNITYYTHPMPIESKTIYQPAPDIAPEPEPNSPEVFYISDNIFTYKEAHAVCKAYGGELASYSQVEKAYQDGAEWCGYGWSADGLALFPTQYDTWKERQKETDPAKRIECGRPGVNGGYFNPATKFGVNCFGVRPDKKLGPAAKVPAKNPAEDKMIDQFRRRLKNFVVFPFNKASWSYAPPAPPPPPPDTSKIQTSQTRMGEMASPFETIDTNLTAIVNNIGATLEFVGTGLTNLVGGK
jgi:hypothetical protein